MGRPAKHVSAKTGVINKEEEAKRNETDLIVRGDSDQLVAPDYLSEEQVALFDYIVKNLENARILGNLDVFMVAQTAIVIDRLQTIELKININGSLLADPKFMSTQDKYFKQFARCCSELSLSPQGRAKLSIAITKPAKEKKTIMDVLNDDDDE